MNFYKKNLDYNKPGKSEKIKKITIRVAYYNDFMMTMMKIFDAVVIIMTII